VVAPVTDSESTERDGYGHHPGWKGGIRIGSAKDGAVTAFIPNFARRRIHEHVRRCGR
jgi:hypothetical protein